MTERIKTYKYSEIFGNTIQGEGHYTGVPTVWIRFWGCNLECNGFSQDNPTDASTWNLDYQKIDIQSISRMEDLPVFNKGCDSSYSWSKKFGHLAKNSTASEICDALEVFLTSTFNPEGKFQHAQSLQWTHLAFTGGEPMMSQNAMVDIMQEFSRRGNVPKYVTVETNGTQRARDKISQYITGHDDTLSMDDNYEMSKNSFHMLGAQQLAAESFSPLPADLAQLQGIEWFWSVSPKLFLSGEQWQDTIKPEIVQSYKMLSDSGQLKFVSDGSERSWLEVSKATALYRELGIMWPVWIMPMGSTVEGQELIQAQVAVQAVERGYNVAARVHCWIFGNSIGK